MNFKYKISYKQNNKLITHIISFFMQIKLFTTDSTKKISFKKQFYEFFYIYFLLNFQKLCNCQIILFNFDFKHKINYFEIFLKNFAKISKKTM